MRAVVYQKGFGVCKKFHFRIENAPGKVLAHSSLKYKTTEDARRALTTVLSIDPSRITYEIKG